MSDLFGSQVALHSKHMILDLKITLWAQGTLPKMIDREQSLKCHPQMQVKALSCKEEAICEHDPET